VPADAPLVTPGEPSLIRRADGGPLSNPVRHATRDITASVDEIAATFPAKTAVASGSACCPNASVLNGSSTTKARSTRFTVTRRPLRWCSRATKAWFERQ
jgi:hypothetical protein